MLQTLSLGKKILEQPSLETLDGDAVWYDLFSPTKEEISKIESLLKVHIQAIDEMMEIEESSRLFEENGVLYMTSTILYHVEGGDESTAPIAFILVNRSLVTVRYCNPKSFQIFAKKVAKNGDMKAEMLLLGLLDTIVERIADVLEINSSAIDLVSQEIFKKDSSNHQREMKDILQHIGKTGDLNSKVRMSLETLDRQLIFFYNQMGEESDKKIRARILTIQQDVKSLVDFLFFLFNKIDFLLNATLGFIDIEQNTIIKIFSVAAVIFLPPTLIASIYGMNFKIIPELEWFFGYPLALLLMGLSAFLPYLYFKRKGWL